MSNDRTTTRIAYVLKRFPRLSETFILDEMLGLEKEGFSLVVYAFADPAEKTVNIDTSRLRAPVVYLSTSQPNFSKGLRQLFSDLLNHVRLFVARPSAYVRSYQVLFGSKYLLASVKNINYGFRLVRDLEGRGVTHIHAGFVHSPARAALTAARFTKTSFSMAGHAKDIYTSSPDSIAGKAAFCEFILTCSMRARNEITQRLDQAGGSRYTSRVRLIHHGVDVDRFRPLENPVVRVGHEIIFLAVGRLVEKKGFNNLIRAFSQINSSGTSMKLRIIGDGPDKLELMHLVDTLGQSKSVSFLGALTREVVLTEMQNADVFVHPSVVLSNGDQDGIPNVVLEAMAVGLCVVGSDIEGICEVIQNGISGLIAKSGDVQSLALAMERAINDGQLRERLGQRAREVVCENYSKDAAIAKVAKEMAQVVGADGARILNDSPNEVVA